MIRTALKFISNELEAYIIERENSDDYLPGTVVELEPVMSPAGTLNMTTQKHIAVMLVGIEEERREAKRTHLLSAENNSFVRLNPPVELGLYVLFVAHQGDYETALRDLSDVIAFFQSKSVFDQQKYPALNANPSVTDPSKPWQSVDRLSFRLCNLSFEQQNNLWAMFGGKYIPSALYKMSMLTIFETKSREKAAPVTELGFAEGE